MRAVTVLGPESTGKTALAAELAATLGAALSGEAARDYALGVGRALGVEDVEPIARAQVALEDAAAVRAAGAGRSLVVRDTDLVSTATYAAWYYGLRAAWLDAMVAERRAALYLLCDTDLAWRPEAPRDPAMRDAAVRDALRGEFVRALERYGCEWAWVRGHGARRLACAMRHLRTAGFDHGN